MNFRFRTFRFRSFSFFLYVAFGLHGLKMFFSWEESRSTSQAQRRAEVSPFQAVLAPEADRRCERELSQD